MQNVPVTRKRPGSERQKHNDCGVMLLRNVSLLLAGGAQVPWTVPRTAARAPRLEDLRAGRPEMSGADLRAGLHRLLTRMCAAGLDRARLEAIVAGHCNPLLRPPACHGPRRLDPNG